MNSPEKPITVTLSHRGTAYRIEKIAGAVTLYKHGAIRSRVGDTLTEHEAERLAEWNPRYITNVIRRK